MSRYIKRPFAYLFIHYVAAEDAVHITLPHIFKKYNRHLRFVCLPLQRDTDEGYLWHETQITLKALRLKCRPTLWTIQQNKYIPAISKANITHLIV